VTGGEPAKPTPRFVGTLPRRLEETGTRDLPRALSLVECLLPVLPFGDEGWETLLAAARRAPDPALLLLNLCHLAEALPPEALAAPFARPSVVPYLAAFLGGSAFFPVQLSRRPGLFALLFAEGGVEAPADGEALREELCGAILAAPAEEEAKALLRRAKLREMSRIAARDLSGAASLPETTGSLSDLASAALSAAVLFGRRVLDERFGKAIGELPDGSRREARFAVMGMGKLGARELNFSSDIDLIYFYETDRGGTDGGSEGKPLSLHQYFVRLSEIVTRLVSEVTADGFVFRTDLRLRPEGNKGDLALSLRSGEIYYEAYGQTWERAALIKARPVAGDIDLGEEFLRLVAPFVFRKYMDFLALEEIKEMKDRVNEEVARRRLSGKDIKLGTGGIREIEFFVQAHQLIYGGKVPSLRTRGTVETLSELTRLGMVSEEERKGLAAAYDFLRRLEHRIQVFGERQTHILPGKEEDLFRLARAMGFSRSEELTEALARHEATVAECFGRLFGGRTTEETPARALPLLDPEAGDEELLSRLSAAGFADPSLSLGALHTLRDGPPHVRLTSRARRYLHKVAPVLLDRILDTPDPAMALSHVDRFLASIGARTLFYAMLHENRTVIDLLVRLFGTSPFLSGYLLRHPDLLDTFLRNDLSAPLKSKSDFRRDLGEAMRNCSDFEQELEELRRFKHLEELRIGMHELGGNLALEEATFQLAALAETILAFAYGMARRELSRRYGVPYLEGTEWGPDGSRAEAAFCILALGKLGAEEISYHSDLDIIFLYEGAGETGPPARGEEGFRSISNHEYFAKVAQRLISILTTVTREGYAYNLDTRLRPSGNAGPLVSSFAAFESYHDRTAQLWERQALLKGRFVAGDRPFGKKVEAQLRHVLFDHPLPAEAASEIHRLRTRMELEVGKEGAERWNLKVGRGGIVDVEFAVQYLQLVHGADHPSVRSRATLTALFELRRAGILDEARYEVLSEGYRFLRSLEVRLRLLHDASIDRIDPSMVDGETLSRYREETGKIRAAYLKILGIGADGEGAEGERKG
jgi:glutamate-ammonia-ligase adenylyltransferase